MINCVRQHYRENLIFYKYVVCLYFLYMIDDIRKYFGYTQRMIFEHVGYVAAFLTTVAFLPQALQTIKTRNTASLSLSMYGLFTAGVFCWLLYGFVLDDYAIILANVVTLLLALSIFSIKLINVIKYREK